MLYNNHVNTNKETRIQAWCKKHALHAIVGVLGLCAGFVLQKELPEYQAHFLQHWRPAQTAIRSTQKQRQPKKQTRPRKRASPTLKSVQSNTPSLQKPASRSRQPLAVKTPSTAASASAARSYKAWSFASTPATALHGAAPASAMSSSASPVTVVASDDFPAFGRAMMPVGKTPAWGTMRTPDEWNRTYKEMPADAFVAIPRYDLAALRTPLMDLVKPLNEENMKLITAKLFYSTKFFGAYNIDADEFTAVHPGLDLKLALGTPIGAIAGGRVHAVQRTSALGLHVMIEHHLPNGEVVYSIYGHLDSAAVSAGDDVTPGQYIGNAGSSGNSSGPHLHLQIDIQQPGETGTHVVYWPEDVPSASTAAQYVYHPMHFIAKYANGASDTTVTQR